MSIGGGLWLQVRMLSSLFDHSMTAGHLTRSCPHWSVVFNTPYAVVDVTVSNFLGMCLVNRSSYQSIDHGNGPGINNGTYLPMEQPLEYSRRRAHPSASVWRRGVVETYRRSNLKTRFRRPERLNFEFCV
ncbi:hypothetical protein EVAR_4246_1 [Eumeta japonica]|uniref:Uncharacterized protein n=1 Tax=Eumeta variegata TaxID=151549 RepID=A0A4C1TJM9_EUMVA|nr:hypothetical protein EVAR_4246_1 [Eumeta japonica]